MPKMNYTLHQGDALEYIKEMESNSFDAIVTDPPYGINYQSSSTGHDGGTALPGIVGDENTLLRDYIIEKFSGKNMIIFGSWKRKKPTNCRGVLIWDKGNHVGMGDLTFPWKPNTEEIYIIGPDFSGKRGSSVLRHNAPVTWNSTTHGRNHPHEKPVSLLIALLDKLNANIIFDPFMGSGTTGVAAIQLGRQFIGCEINPEYYAIAEKRIAQAALQPGLFTASNYACTGTATPQGKQGELFNLVGE